MLCQILYYRTVDCGKIYTYQSFELTPLCFSFNNNFNSPETVLLVDDEDFILKVGSQILQELGYTVLTAGSGKEALDIYTANRDKIDVVVLDMIMPPAKPNIKPESSI